MRRQLAMLLEARKTSWTRDTAMSAAPPSYTRRGRHEEVVFSSRGRGESSQTLKREEEEEEEEKECL